MMGLSIKPQPKRDSPMSDLAIRVAPDRTVAAREMETLIDAFIADKTNDNHKKTMEGYVREVAPFRRWWREFSHIHDFVLSAETFKAFIHWCENDYRNAYGEPASTYTLHKITVRVRHILTWAHEKGYVSASITELCPLYHHRDTVKYYPGQEELAALVNAPAGKERVRDMAFLAFSLSTGARRNEIVNAKVQDVVFNTPLENITVGDDHGGHVHLRIVKGDSEGVGKGRDSVFCSKTGLLLKIWIRSIGEMHGNIFGLGYVGIQNIIRNIAVSCNIPDIHQHAFRSAFIDHWSFKHANTGYMAAIALKLQVGHAIDKGEFGATGYYINTNNPRRNLELIKQFHCSPLDLIDVDWFRLPVQIHR